MLQKSLAIALILLMIAPLNAGASAFMAMSMVDGGHAALATADLKAAPKADHNSGLNAQHQSHDLSMANAESHGVHSNHIGTHDQHSEEDCQEYCLSCSNHCSSLTVLSNHAASFTQIRVLSAASIGLSSNHSDLLFRPPISV